MPRLVVFLILSLTLAAQAARETVEVKLFKGNSSPAILDGVGILLKATNIQKQRYSIELTINGHVIERKDLDIRVPFYFYVGANTTAHELVILKVEDNQITGRLSSPK
jgi:hypothetical protein